ncbi:MAG: hypothetical protein V4503_09750 [Gemmatimonadota bacterium]
MLLTGCNRGASRRGPERDTTLGAAAEPHFLFPGPGDTLVEGSTYVLRWVPWARHPVNLGAVMGGKDKGMLLTRAVTGLDSLVWTVPAGFVTGFGIPASDQVRLRLENADSTDQWVDTAPFTIIGSAASDTLHP